MAHPLTQTDGIIMFSGVLLAVSLFAMSGDEGMPRSVAGPRRMIGYIFMNLGRTFWAVWFLICLTVFTGGLVMKFKYHKEYLWKEGKSKGKQGFFRAFQRR